MLDEDAIVACADIVGRTGAAEFEIGYLRDDVPPEEAGWYASARYRGTRVIVDEARGPSEAADGLARKLLEGGRCRRCGEPVTLMDARDGCRWTRFGPKWTPGCGQEIDRTIPTHPLARGSK